MNSPYEFLGLDPSCTDEEMEARYTQLKMQFSEDRFLEGEAGRIGAENLTKLESCYSEIHRMRTESARAENGLDLDGIDELIKQGRLDEAQSALDSMSTRPGRWHYLQAIVFYKRNWFTDSLRQLNVALSLEPDNEQFRKSKEALERNINGGAQPGNTASAEPTMGDPNQPKRDDAMGAANCCQALCCADCLCSWLRCVGCG